MFVVAKHDLVSTVEISTVCYSDELCNICGYISTAVYVIHILSCAIDSGRVFPVFNTTDFGTSHPTEGRTRR